jgi:hypothetical protein
LPVKRLALWGTRLAAADAGIDGKAGTGSAGTGRRWALALPPPGVLVPGVPAERWVGITAVT